jgi:hypothetical protein
MNTPLKQAFGELLSIPGIFAMAVVLSLLVVWDFSSALFKTAVLGMSAGEQEEDLK